MIFLSKDTSMFTGMVLKSIQINSLRECNDARRFGVVNDAIFLSCAIGDSVAIDGACHTIEEIKPESVCFFSSRETVSKTIVKHYRRDICVNIEMPMVFNGTFGGHPISGHVDTTSIVKSVDTDSDGRLLYIEIPDEFLAYVVYKGSIAINGVSLTVNSIEKCIVGLYLIPVTIAKTSLGVLKVGDIVNVEFDMLGKYVVNAVKIYAKN